MVNVVRGHEFSSITARFLPFQSSSKMRRDALAMVISSLNLAILIPWPSEGQSNVGQILEAMLMTVHVVFSI